MGGGNGSATAGGVNFGTLVITRARSLVLGHTAERAPTTCRSEPMVMVLSSVGYSFPCRPRLPPALRERLDGSSSRTVLDRTLGITN
jgi:hypothetical protein